MTTDAPTAPTGHARPGLLELGLGLVVAGPWLAGTISILSRPLDLGFTTSNLPWQLLLSWVFPTALLALVAAISRARIVALCAVVAAGIEVVGLLIVTVVQLSLGADGDFVAQTLGMLAASAGVAVAATLALAAARGSAASRVLRIIAFVVALLTLLVRQAVALSETTRALIDIPDPTLTAPLLGRMALVLVLVVGVAISVVRVPALRWVAGAVIVASVLLEGALLTWSLVAGSGAVSAGAVIDGLLTIAGGVLVGCSAFALSRELRAARASAPASATPAQAAQQQQTWRPPGAAHHAPAEAGAAPHLPPPVPGTHMPPPGGTRPQ